jgi:hypothetical protein
MTRPVLTAEKSVREQLHELFLAMAQRSFDTCMESQNRVNFYDGVIARVQAGGDISADVPEVTDKSVAEVVAVARTLRQQAAGAAISAWELSAALAGSFRTTVRSVEAQGELIPQYDVEHVADTEAGQVRISIRTWRRNLDVEIVGADAGINAMNAQMALAALHA